MSPEEIGDLLRRASQHGPLDTEEHPLSETRQYRKFTAQQKTEIVLASLRGPKTMTELCREHDIADSLLRKWREQFLAAGAERLSGKSQRTELDDLRAQVSKLGALVGTQDDGGRGRGGTLAGMG